MAFCVSDSPVSGLTVKPSPSAPAQVFAGSVTIVPSGLFRQGTSGFPSSVARPVTMDCCAFRKSDGKKGFDIANGLGPAKIELCVSKGTAFCESCRRPSKAPYKNVLSFLIGPPSEPPNCCRDNEFLIG